MQKFDDFHEVQLRHSVEKFFWQIKEYVEL